MRRTGRRHSDYFESNEELNETYETYESYDADEDLQAYDEDVIDETEEAAPGKTLWIKIGKIALIILVLIALFFISMKVTEIFLDRNQEPQYGVDAPAYNDSESSDDEDVPAIKESDEDMEMEEYKEEDLTQPPSEEKPEEEKPAETPKPAEKPAETPKPAEKPAEKPEDEPSTPAPSTPSKPIITPGNPAA